MGRIRHGSQRKKYLELRRGAVGIEETVKQLFSISNDALPMPSE